MRRRANILLVVLSAALTGTGAAAELSTAAPDSSLGASVYAQWSNGPPKSASWFALGTWLVDPRITGKCGVGCGKTDAEQEAAEHMNLLVGIGQNTWPEGFGSDDGELEAIKKAGLYASGGYNTPYSENTSNLSVASMQALAYSIGATANLIGYNVGDEPDCAGDGGQPPLNQMEATVRAIAGFDPTRLATWNQTQWLMQPYFFSGGSCSYPVSVANFKQIGVGGFDYYPLTNPNLIHYDWSNPGILPSHYYAAKSDFLSVPNDTLYVQGIVTQAMRRQGRPGQPIWVATESGGDNLASGGYATFPAGLTSGSTRIVNASSWSSFTSLWLGLTVSGAGIPAGATITRIVSDTVAVMSAAATATSARTSVSVMGGVGFTGYGNDGDCVASANICVVNGNEYRPTKVQVAAEVWMSIINGANGIMYFCQDGASSYFCLGDVGGGPRAEVVSRNLTQVNARVLSYAPALNASRVGMCSMDSLDYETGALSVRRSCANGILTMATDRPEVPGAALATALDGKTYVFAQSSRDGRDGATMTFTLSGRARKTATVVYDSDVDYDPEHSSVGATVTLSDSGQFSDRFGRYGDDYQVKIYRIR